MKPRYLIIRTTDMRHFDAPNLNLCKGFVRNAHGIAFDRQARRGSYCAFRIGPRGAVMKLVKRPQLEKK